MISKFLETLTPTHFYCPMCDREFECYGRPLYTYTKDNPYRHICCEKVRFDIWLYQDTYSRCNEICIRPEYYRQEGEILCPKILYSCGFCKSSLKEETGGMAVLEFSIHASANAKVKISCDECEKSEGACKLSEEFRLKIKTLLNAGIAGIGGMELTFKLLFDGEKVRQAREDLKKISWERIW